MTLRVTTCPRCGQQTGMYESGRNDSIAANKCVCPPDSTSARSPEPTSPMTELAAFDLLLSVTGLGVHTFRPTRSDALCEREAAWLIHQYRDAILRRPA